MAVRCSIITPCFMYGGAETWMRDLVRATQGPAIHWNEVCVLDCDATSGDKSIFERFDVRVTCGAAAAARLTETEDVLVAWGTDVPGWSPASRARLIFVAHNDGACEASGRALEANIRANLQVAVSRVAAPGLRSEARRTICNAIDKERLRPSLPRGALRSSLGIPPSAKILGLVGRGAWQKNTWDAINVLAALDESWHLVLAGTDQDRFLPFAARLGVRDRVHVIGFRNDIANVLQDLDALLVTSAQEGFSYVIAEAWATGTPVFSTPVGIAKLWPSAVVGLPHGMPWDILGDPERIVPFVEQRGPFIEAARIIQRAFESGELAEVVRTGLAVVDEQLSLESFGRAWTEAIVGLMR